MHCHKISYHYGIISTEKNNFLIMIFIIFGFENIMGLAKYAWSKCIVNFLVILNHLVHNWNFFSIIKEYRNCVFNSTHNSQLWIINIQYIITELKIWISIKHNNICDSLIWVKNIKCSRNILHIRCHISPLHNLNSLDNQHVTKLQQEYFYLKPICSIE